MPSGTHEQTINVALGELLADLGRTWTLRAEPVGQIFLEGGRPDILVEKSDGWPIVVEAEVDNPAQAELEARSRLGRHLVSTGVPIHASVALVYARHSLSLVDGKSNARRSRHLHNHQHPSDAAQRVLAEYGDVSIPVPVEKIIKRRGIRVQFSPLDQELSGMALIKDGVGVIGVNALHHPNRQRFTMAHELGHHVLHRSEIDGTAHVDKGFAILLRDTEASQGTNKMEIEANTFASELLMPTSLLTPLVNASEFDLDDVELLQTLAKRFRVSLSALQFRLLALS